MSLADQKLCNKFTSFDDNGEEYSGKEEIEMERLRQYCDQHPESQLAKLVNPKWGKPTEAVTPPFPVPRSVVTEFVEGFTPWQSSVDPLTCAARVRLGDWVKKGDWSREYLGLAPSHDEYPERFSRRGERGAWRLWIVSQYLEYLGLDTSLRSLCNQFKGRHGDGAKTFEIDPHLLLRFCVKFPDSVLALQVAQPYGECNPIVPPMPVPDRLVEAFTKNFSHHHCYFNGLKMAVARQSVCSPAYLTHLGFNPNLEIVINYYDTGSGQSACKTVEISPTETVRELIRRTANVFEDVPLGKVLRDHTPDDNDNVRLGKGDVKIYGGPMKIDVDETWPVHELSMALGNDFPWGDAGRIRENEYHFLAGPCGHPLQFSFFLEDYV